MRCKNCREKLEKNSNICPVCGEVNEGNSVSKKLKVMKILTFGLIGLILVGALAGAVSYGLTGRILPGKNNIFYKKSYSVSLEKLNTVSGNKSFQKSRDEVVASVGELTLTNRMLQVYYWDAVSGSEYADLNKKTPLDQQYQNAAIQKTWQQFFIEQAIDTWHRDALVKQMAQKAGFEMPETYVKQFETLEKDITATATSSNFTSLDAFLEDMLGCGTDFQTYYDYLWTYFVGGLYWAEYIEGVEVNMDEVEAYYEEHKAELVLDESYQVTKESGKLVDVRHILIKPKTTTDEDGNTTITEEAWETCRVEAQAILDSWLAGEHTEDGFAKLAGEKSEDGGSKSNGGLYTDVYKGMMVQPFNNWCFDESRQPGDYGLVKTNIGYHIMYFVGSEEGWIRLCTEGAKTEKSSKIMDEMVANSPIKVNYRKIALAELS